MDLKHKAMLSVRIEGNSTAPIGIAKAFSSSLSFSFPPSHAF